MGNSQPASLQQVQDSLISLSNEYIFNRTNSTGLIKHEKEIKQLVQSYVQSVLCPMCKFSIRKFDQCSVIVAQYTPHKNCDECLLKLIKFCDNSRIYGSLHSYIAIDFDAVKYMNSLYISFATIEEIFNTVHFTYVVQLVPYYIENTDNDLSEECCARIESTYKGISRRSNISEYKNSEHLIMVAGEKGLFNLQWMVINMMIADHRYDMPIPLHVFRSEYNIIITKHKKRYRTAVAKLLYRLPYGHRGLVPPLCIAIASWVV